MNTPFDLHEDLLYVVRRTKTNFIEQGKCLYELRKNSVYREAIGEGINSWHEYLSQPEIGMSPTQANKLLHIYELFILKLKYDEEEIIKIPVKTINYIIKRKEEFESFSKEKQEEIVSQAQVLNFKDFKEAYFDQKENNEVRTYEYVVMQKCHQTSNLSKVHGLNSSDIADFIHNHQNND